MSQQKSSPLSEPLPWNLVAEGYDQFLYDQFGPYAERALELAAITPQAEILDVACGPGTLSTRAAPRVRRVTSLDFSEDMITRLRRRCADAGLSNIEVRSGDGQQLPFAEGSFDAVFSMFGLMFFPDRHRGFSELCRVLRPGAKAVNGSWAPLDQSPVLRTLFGALGELLPDLPLGNGPAPLSSPEAIEEEMSQAGLRDVDVHRVTQGWEAASLDEFWREMLASNAPLLLIRRNLGDAWPDFESKLVAKLRNELGDGPVRADMQALLGVGTRP